MLLHIRDAYVAAFISGFHHQLKRVAAGFNGAHDCFAGRLSQSCLSVRLAFHDAPYSRRFIRWLVSDRASIAPDLSEIDSQTATTIMIAVVRIDNSKRSPDERSDIRGPGPACRCAHA